MTVIAFGERKIYILSNVSKKIIYVIISIEQVILLIYYLTFSVMDFKSIECYATVFFCALSYIKARFVYYFYEFVAILERTTTYRSNAVGNSYAGKVIATIERIFINFIILTVIVFRECKICILSNVSKKIIYVIVSIE